MNQNTINKIENFLYKHYKSISIEEISKNIGEKISPQDLINSLKNDYKIGKRKMSANIAYDIYNSKNDFLFYHKDSLLSFSENDTIRITNSSHFYGVKRINHSGSNFEIQCDDGTIFTKNDLFFLNKIISIDNKLFDLFKNIFQKSPYVSLWYKKYNDRIFCHAIISDNTQLVNGVSVTHADSSVEYFMNNLMYNDLDYAINIFGHRFYNGEGVRVTSLQLPFQGRISIEYLNY